ncbi:4Fe-4S binding protein [Methanocaldococcus indicus]|uniref:4Fe-4S binding protein n=1 Tax=Methanocaldococcus indicus TaxID=213231 RepID=UPI003C6DB323
MVIQINYDLCRGPDCAECVNNCPMEVFEIQGDKVVVAREEECTLCGVCKDVCPTNAIILEE